MKKFRSIVVAVCLFLCVTFGAGCYVTNAQPMKKIKGTYKLTQYKTTDKRYDENDSVVTTVVDKIVEEGMEVYLVVTGESTGYYAYKDKETEAYAQEVELYYEASPEDTSEYTFVGYRVNTYSDFDKFGVTKNRLNKSVPSICMKIKDRPMYQQGYDKDWEKVSDAIDLSYVSAQLGGLTPYKFGESIV